jgi:putative ABC transport system substrate-binding protein
MSTLLNKSALLLLAVTIGVGTPSSAAADAPSLLIVKSEDLPQYGAPIAAFQEATTMDAEIVDIAGSREKGTALLQTAVSKRRPDAIFALGAKAAYLSKQVMPDTPIVFAMVLNWEKFGLKTDRTTGVAVEIPEDVLLTRFKLVLPDLRRLGVICGEENCRGIVEKASAAAAQLGIELVVSAVKHPENVPGAYRRMRTGIDALWMVPDPSVMTRDNFSYLSSRTQHDGVAFLAFSENFVRAGALLSVAPSYQTMGSQAAVLMNKVLNSTGSVPPVQPPVGSTLVINASTAEELGIQMDAATLNMFDKVLDSTDSP